MKFSHIIYNINNKNHDQGKKKKNDNIRFL